MKLVKEIMRMPVIISTDTPNDTAQRQQPDLALAPPSRLARVKRWLSAHWKQVDRQGLIMVAVLFVASRLLYLLATALDAHLTLPPSMYALPFPTPFWHAWFHWDANFYANIAKLGYPPHYANKYPAFFPLYPITERLLAPLGGGDPYVAGFYVANVAWFVALYELYVLARRDFDARVARGAIIAVTVFPTALFGFVPYSEAPFLALVLASFLCMRRGQWGWAALWGMLAALTRQTGVLLVLPFVVEYITQHGYRWQQLGWRGRGWGSVPVPRLTRDGAWVLLIPGGMLLFILWLWHAVGDPLAFLHDEKTWHRASAFPLATLWNGFWFATRTPGYFGFRAWQEFAVVVAVGIVTVCVCRQTRLSYSLFTVVLYLLFLSQPNVGFPLESQSRYALELFPLFIVLGDFATRRRWRMVVLIALCLPLQLVLMGAFSRGSWVV